MKNDEKREEEQLSEEAAATKKGEKPLYATVRGNTTYVPVSVEMVDGLHNNAEAMLVNPMSVTVIEYTLPSGEKPRVVLYANILKVKDVVLTMLNHDAQAMLEGWSTSTPGSTKRES